MASIINPSGPPLERKVLLNSGQEMPLIGFGTFQSESKTAGGCKAAVLAALKAGYRHLDTAYSYGVEEEVGEAMKQAIEEGWVTREEIFVTTKLHQTFHEKGNVETGLRRSLERLGVDYVDLFLMHFPHAYAPDKDLETQRHPDGKPIIDLAVSREYVQTWEAMEAEYASGRARSIGVSNFNILKLKKLLAATKTVPAVNQIELHPYLPQRKLLAFCAEKGIHVTGHSPLGGAPIAAVAKNMDKGRPLEDPLILDLAQKYSVQPSQIILSWALQRGTSIVPKSVNPERIRLNAELVELEAEDFERIEGLKKEGEEIRFNDHRDHIGFDIFDEELDQPMVETSAS